MALPEIGDVGWAGTLNTHLSRNVTFLNSRTMDGYSASHRPSSGRPLPWETATNVVLNGIAKNNTTGWSKGSGTSTILRVADSYVADPDVTGITNSVRSTPSDMNAINTRVYVNVYGSGVKAGRRYHFFYLQRMTPTSNLGIGAIARWWNASGTQIGNDVVIRSSSGGFTQSGEWRLPATSSAVAPSGAVEVTLHVYAYRVAGAGTWYHWVTGVCITDSEEHQDWYFDGNGIWGNQSLSNSEMAWDGEEHNSPSVIRPLNNFLTNALITATPTSKDGTYRTYGSVLLSAAAGDVDATLRIRRNGTAPWGQQASYGTPSGPVIRHDNGGSSGGVTFIPADGSPATSYSSLTFRVRSAGPQVAVSLNGILYMKSRTEPTTWYVDIANHASDDLTLQPGSYLFMENQA